MTVVARILRAVAIAACVPYLVLKVAWIAGSHAGIPAGSELLEHRATMAVANTVTVLMDAAVILLALALTRPWGRRVPGWALLLPLWGATGLLAPIAVGFPLQLAAEASGGTTPVGDGGGEYLDAWVFGVVYTGFGVQALALGGLFVLYVRERWGASLTGALPPGAGVRLPLCVAGLSLLAACVHLRSAVDDPVAGGPDVLWALVTAAAALLVVAPAPRVRTVVVLGWAGGSASSAWGAWALLFSLADGPFDENRPSALLSLTYAGQMVAGGLLLLLGARLLAGRRAVPAGAV
ncbi:hypothetical protein SRB5_24610 [Streptomyces sp. RB5]|uniref:LigA protein n=1 Tax=Streptomyces smaragdinus TaxID=2585196 RepID=A0A7K0CFU6_9ACTN|nr:hypothetical protein [Streptomyces smaragdinus]MQY12328.1 hypothetical protein [Streptomyces smaragdinus]